LLSIIWPEAGLMNTSDAANTSMTNRKIIAPPPQPT
jgi:hypothetical protein